MKKLTGWQQKSAIAKCDNGEMTKWSTPRVTCECGLSLHEGPAQSARHRHSTFHRQHKRIRALLANPCIGYGEIARRIGVSRERFRQMAGAMGAQRSRARKAACRLEAELTLWWKLHRRHPVIVKAMRMGMDVKPIKTANGRLDRTLVTINSFSVVLFTISTDKRGYLKFHASIREADFYAGVSAQGIYIFPPRVIHRCTATSFAVNPIAGYRVKSQHHDYQQCREAWWQLTKKRKKAKRSSIPA